MSSLLIQKYTNHAKDENLDIPDYDTTLKEIDNTQWYCKPASILLSFQNSNKSKKLLTSGSENVYEKNIFKCSNLDNLLRPNVMEKVEETRDLNLKSNCDLQCKQSNDSGIQFIDPSELKKSLINTVNQIILFDCRPLTEFNFKHIKDSVHLNCRDKITKKRLQTGKLTVKDLISCNELKKKFESAQSYCESNEVETKKQTDNNEIIILYDGNTTDINDFKSDLNPLNIVQNNLKQCGFRNICKILKGIFMRFFE